MRSPRRRASLERLEHAERVAARREREQDVAAPSVGDDLAREDRLGPDVVGDGGDDRRIGREVERGARGPAAGGRRAGEVGDRVHRVGGRAAVAERQQPAAGVEGGAQVGRRGAAGPRSRRRASARAARRPRRPSSPPRRRRRPGSRRGRAPARPGTDRGSSTRRRRARAARCGPRAARGARRRRARAPRARGRPSRPAPGARRDRRSAARAPTRRRAPRRPR